MVLGCKTEFEIELCANDEHLIAKMCELLFKYKTEEEQGKECVMN